MWCVADLEGSSPSPLINLTGEIVMDILLGVVLIVAIFIFFQLRQARKIEKEIIRSIWGKTSDEEKFLP